MAGLPRPAPPLHLRGDGDAHRAPGLRHHQAHAHRHLAGDRHPGDLGDLELRRHLAGGDGEAHHQQLRARADHHGQRHRAHREPVALRRSAWSRSSSSPAPRSRPPPPRSPRSRRPCCARCRPACTPPLIIRYSASNVPILQAVARVATRFASSSSSTSATTSCAPAWRRCRARRSPGPYGGKQRQIMVDLDPQKLYAFGLSPRDVSDAIDRAEPDPALRHGQDRRPRVHRPPQQQPRRWSRSSTTCRSRRVQRRDGLRARRGARARRLRAADQHRPRRRQEGRAACRS